MSEYNNTNNPKLKEYLSYNNPNVGVIRSGEVGDEYVNRNDYLPVINGMITLLEIPSERFGVKIEGFTEIDKRYYENKKYLAENEILVNYPSGVVMFNKVHEGKSFMLNYEGRGVILLSADRVYMMYQKEPSVLVTLSDFANDIKSNLKLLRERIKKYEEVAEYTLNIAEQAKVATDQAIDATGEAKKATQEAINAALSTIMLYEDPIPTFDDLETIYPNPKNGFRVLILSTGDVYRYDGVYSKSWQLIDNLTKYLIPTVTEEYDGILSKEDYRKFQSKPFQFIFQKLTNGGVQDNIAQAPYDGWLNKCYVIMNNNQADTDIEIGIEMITLENFKILHDGIDEDDEGNPIIKTQWTNIFSENIILKPNQFYAEGVIDIPYQNVEKGTLYRVNFKQFDNKMGGITVCWDYWIKKPVEWGEFHLQ